MKVFLDTGAFLALADEDDRYHTAAKSIYTELLQSRPQLLTSNFVLSETYTLIRSKVSHQATVEFMKRLDQTGLKALRVSEAIEQTAKVIFMRYNDKDFSFVDCTSFALIDHHRIDHAFAFDAHFRQYRFKRHVVVLPQEPA
ncbi:MAG TPA: PIN domain-containing protein [Candidatus Binatia bacterium]|nr:PIN domain-containing protein [Candidatus Binatia bacterium]